MPINRFFIFFGLLICEKVTPDKIKNAINPKWEFFTPNVLSYWEVLTISHEPFSCLHALSNGIKESIEDTIIIIANNSKSILYFIL